MEIANNTYYYFANEDLEDAKFSVDVRFRCAVISCAQAQEKF